MKKFWKIAVLSLLLPAGALAQGEARLETAGSITAGVQNIDVDSNSSKFGEYRDLHNGLNLYDLSFLGIDTANGRYLELNGKNLIRDDQSLRLGLGSAGTWRMTVERNEIPHNLSNKAMTPFNDQGNGLYTVASPVLDGPINGYPNTNNTYSRDQVLATDSATAAWLTTNLHKTDLGTQRDKTSATVQITPTEALKFRLTYSDDRKDGSKITYGPIGARPPDTLNIQMAEPIDYVTRELKFEAEYNKDRFQSLFAYTISDFENEVNTLRWQNIWAYNADTSDFMLSGFTVDPDLDPTATSGARRIATFGERALAPDNRYQNATLSLGFDLPLASRLAATLAYGKMEQDETLIPYSTSNFGSTTQSFNTLAGLPRSEANAEIETRLLNLDYTINPIERLNLRAFYRYYDLDNNTDEDQWRYVSSDTVTGTGPTTAKNQRVSLAYAYDQQNYGLDATYRLNLWRTSLGLGVEREEIDRDYREANTDENMLKASIVTRPTNWLTMRAKYLYGDREADNYNNVVTRQSYWYTNNISGTTYTGSDLDNPMVSFSNHPDMRKFDVTDRERNRFDVAATVTPTDALSLSAAYRYQKDDYSSNVTPAAVLADVPFTDIIVTGTAPGTAVVDTNAVSPGDQLGLLKTERNQYTIDASYAVTERLNFTAFATRETIDSTQRGLEFQENNKLNPLTTAVTTPASTNLATNELGPWTRASSQWLAKTEDRTNTFGAGTGYQIIPGKLNFMVDYSFSQGKIDIDYSGFGAVSALNPANTLADNYQFAFRNPSTVTHKQQTVNATLEYQVVKNLVFGLHYLFDTYRISDWAQEAETPWFSSVDNNEFLLRDTSNSHQWGNRLVNMGSYLGPDYDAHLGYVSMTYKF